MEPKPEMNIHELFRRFLRRWPLIILLGSIGALAGLVFSLLRSPVYQAEALLGININYGITESLALVVEDRALSRLGTLVLADSTLERLMDSLPAETKDERNWKSPGDIREDLRLDKRLATWALVVMDTDPEFAAFVAQNWAEATLEIFDEANEHAWRAVRLLSGSFIIDCEERIEEGEGAQFWDCRAFPQGASAEELSEEFEREVALSHGVLPNISYELLQGASPPEEPILWQRAWLILAGTLLGIVLGGGLSLRDTGSAYRAEDQSQSE